MDLTGELPENSPDVWFGFRAFFKKSTLVEGFSEQSIVECFSCSIFAGPAMFCSFEVACPLDPRFL